ncbi:MAG TPA: hypothetical protein VK133_02520, partial [Amoebophilaceae bacterium]|nr:hypothetical protein [Amoebophilaceae bacterium]
MSDSPLGSNLEESLVIILMGSSISSFFVEKKRKTFFLHLNHHLFISFFKGAFLDGIRETSKNGGGSGDSIGIFPTGKPTT